MGNHPMRNGSMCVLESWSEEKDVLGINMIVSDGVKNTTEYKAYIGRDKPVRDLVANYVFNKKRPVTIYIGDYSHPLLVFQHTSKYIKITYNDVTTAYLRIEQFSISPDLNNCVWAAVLKVKNNSC